MLIFESDDNQNNIGEGGKAISLQTNAGARNNKVHDELKMSLNVQTITSRKIYS